MPLRGMLASRAATFVVAPAARRAAVVAARGVVVAVDVVEPVVVVAVVVVVEAVVSTSASSATASSTISTLGVGRPVTCVGVSGGGTVMLVVVGRGRLHGPHELLGLELLMLKLLELMLWRSFARSLSFLRSLRACRALLERRYEFPHGMKVLQQMRRNMCHVSNVDVDVGDVA